MKGRHGALPELVPRPGLLVVSVALAFASALSAASSLRGPSRGPRRRGSRSRARARHQQRACELAWTCARSVGGGGGDLVGESRSRKKRMQKPRVRAAVGLLARTVARMPQRERRGQRGARGEDAPVHLVDEHERELGVDAELPELHLQADGPGLGLGVRLARARERLADVARAERVADEDHERVGAFEHLRRVGRAGVGGGDTVAEEGDGAPLQLDDTILGRRAREVRLDVGPARDGGGG